jgi:alpha-L-fucosidase
LAAPQPPAVVDTGRGEQRLPVDRLDAWRRLDYGMFVHFGMSTYDGVEFSLGNKPSSTYAPGRLDVDQWSVEWFHVDNYRPRSDAELLGIRLLSRERGANLLLDVPPDRDGLISETHIGALQRLAGSIRSCP